MRSFICGLMLGIALMSVGAIAMESEDPNAYPVPNQEETQHFEQPQELESGEQQLQEEKKPC